MTSLLTHEPQGRTSGSGLAAVRSSRRTPWALIALAVLLVAGLVIGTQTHSRHSRPAAGTFGGYPAFLPKATVDGSALHRVVDAAVASPDLASQGDTVRVHTKTGTVLVTVTGPEVPNEGLPYQSGSSPATWTISMSHPTGTIPVNVNQFTSVDDSGHAYHPTYVSAQAPLPATVPTSGLRFKIITTMKVGEGTLQYAPDAGPKIPVSWDFVVEDD